MGTSAIPRSTSTSCRELLDLAARTELIDEVLFMVRTVPDDGAERDLWISPHRRPDAPALARQVNDDLRRSLTGASVRTEAFVTVVVPEARIGRDGQGVRRRPRRPRPGAVRADGARSRPSCAAGWA